MTEEKTHRAACMSRPDFYAKSRKFMRKIVDIAGLPWYLIKAALKGYGRKLRLHPQSESCKEGGNH